MGMYTEIYVKVSLVENINEEVVNTLKYMMGMVGNPPETLPSHDLFKTSRWNFMLRCSSYYHIPKSVGDFWFDDIAKQWFLVSRSDLKNYGDEIKLFFDWISQYVESHDEQTFIGYFLYEEDSEPTLVYV